MALEQAQTMIEKAMLQLPVEASKEDHRMYLAGYIVALRECGQISEEDRENLYCEYAG